MGFHSRARRCSTRSRERGASLVEYALLLALIAVVCIGAVTLLGGRSSDTFTKAGNSVAGTPGAAPPAACMQTVDGGSHWFPPDGGYLPGPCP